MSESGGSSVSWGRAAASALCLLFMLYTAYAWLDMTWLLDPFYQFFARVDQILGNPG